MTLDAHAVRALDPHELPGVAGGSPISYSVGYTIGFLFRLIVDADPFDGNYYGVGA